MFRSADCNADWHASTSAWRRVFSRVNVLIRSASSALVRGCQCHVVKSRAVALDVNPHHVPFPLEHTPL